VADVGYLGVKRDAHLLSLGLALAAGLSAGCLYDHQAIVARLEANDPRDQASAMAEAVRAGDKATIPVLIELLESEDEGVRFMSAAALRRFTGDDKGFQFAKESDRPRIVAQWRRWWEAEGAKIAPGATAPSATPKAAAGQAPASKPPA
jgi:HEAT repeat protein